MAMLIKIIKSKSINEILANIEYEKLKNFGFILVTLFMLNPAIKVLMKMLFDVSMDVFMHEYNTFVLIFGTVILAIYVKKIQSEGKLSDIKSVLKRNMPITLFLVFAILMIVTTMLNGLPNIAIYGSYYRGEGLVGYLSYIVYFLMSALLFTQKQKQKALNLFVLGASFVGATIFVDSIFLNDKYQFAMGDYMVFSQYNHLGYYLLMSIMTFGMLFITQKKILYKILYLCGFVLMVTALIINDTWGCQVALFIGIFFTIIVYSIGKGKFKFITLVLVIAIVMTYQTAYVTVDSLRDKIIHNIQQQTYDTNALINKDEITFETTGVARLILWENALKILWEKPIIGHGADVTGKRLKEMTDNNDRCHCEFLNYAVSYGIPSAFVYIAAVFTVYLRGLLKKKQLTDINLCGLCIAFAYLTSSLIGNSMYYTAPFLFITLGFGYVRGNNAE